MTREPSDFVMFSRRVEGIINDYASVPFDLVPVPWRERARRCWRRRSLRPWWRTHDRVRVADGGKYGVEVTTYNARSNGGYSV